MHDDFDSLCASYLDGTLDERSRDELAALLESDPVKWPYCARNFSYPGRWRGCARTWMTSIFSAPSCLTSMR